MKKFKIPELLAPAGSLEKLKLAVLYGADAVYLGGQKFGLRAAADNFTIEELEQGVSFAHTRGAKVYVVLNSFLYDQDLVELPAFLEVLENLAVDAVIVSDLGVVETVKRHSKLPIHISTQASALNSASAELWKSYGAERIILGREVSLYEAQAIAKKTGVELEMFIHGSMCMAYSGNCIISNLTQGRDSNRGGCAHSCRFEYSLDFKEQEESSTAYFMSSKDLNGVALIPTFINAGIDSVKIEGRMKGPLYASTITKIYREALDYYASHGELNSRLLIEWQAELNKVSHRDYTTAALDDKADASSIFDERENSDSPYVFVGKVLEVNRESVVIDCKHTFEVGEKLEIIPFKGNVIEVSVEIVTDILNRPLNKTKPSSLVKIPFIENVASEFVIRKSKVKAISPEMVCNL